MEYPIHDFVSRWDVQDMIPSEMEMPTSQRMRPVLTGLVEEKLFEELQVRYDAAKEEVKNPLFNKIEEAIVLIIQHRKMDSLLMKNI